MPQDSGSVAARGALTLVDLALVVSRLAVGRGLTGDPDGVELLAPEEGSRRAVVAGQ